MIEPSAREGSPSQLVSLDAELGQVVVEQAGAGEEDENEQRGGGDEGDQQRQGDQRAQDGGEAGGFAQAEGEGQRQGQAGDDRSGGVDDVVDDGFGEVRVGEQAGVVADAGVGCALERADGEGGRSGPGAPASR